MKYHIFQAVDYKGGELDCNVNLSARELADEIFEMFISMGDEEFNLDDEQLQSKLIKNYEDNVSDYAASDKWAIKVFKTTDEGLLLINPMVEVFEEIKEVFEEFAGDYDGSEFEE